MGDTAPRLSPGDEAVFFQPEIWVARKVKPVTLTATFDFTEILTQRLLAAPSLEAVCEVEE